MDLARPRPTEWIAGLAGLALLVSLFLPWYGSEGEAGADPASGWGSLTVIDFLLALAGLLGIAVVVLALLRRSDATLIATTSIATIFAMLGAALVLIRLAFPADGPDGGPGAHEAGVFIAVAAALTLLVAIGLSLRNDRPRAERGRGLPQMPEIRDLGVPEPGGSARGDAGRPATP